MKNTRIIPDEMAKMSVALFSESQNCFHIEELRQYIEITVRDAIHKKGDNDYMLIGIFNNDEEASEFIALIRDTQKKLAERKNSELTQ